MKKTCSISQLTEQTRGALRRARHPRARRAPQRPLPEQNKTKQIFHPAGRARYARLDSSQRGFRHPPAYIHAGGAYGDDDAGEKSVRTRPRWLYAHTQAHGHTARHGRARRGTSRAARRRALVSKSCARTSTPFAMLFANNHRKFKNTKRNDVLARCATLTEQGGYGEQRRPIPRTSQRLSSRLGARHGLAAALPARRRLHPHGVGQAQAPAGGGARDVGSRRGAERPALRYEHEPRCGSTARAPTPSMRRSGGSLLA